MLDGQKKSKLDTHGKARCKCLLLFQASDGAVLSVSSCSDSRVDHYHSPSKGLMFGSQLASNLQVCPI